MRYNLALLVGLSWMMAGCQGPGRSTVALTRADHDRVVQVVRGDILTVRLPGNPTTGYRWEPEERDESPLHLIDSTYQAAYPERVGSGGDFVFRFRARAKGETRLRLIYARSWETGAADEFEVTIQIQ